MDRKNQIRDLSIAFENQNKSKPKLMLLFMTLLFLIPMILAWVMYEKRDSFGTVNYGHLILPPASINDLKLINYQPQKKWLLLLFYPKICDQGCNKGLFYMRQIRLSMGKDMDRIERAIITDQKAPQDPSLEKLLNNQFFGTAHLLADQKQLNIVLSKAVKSRLLTAGTLYVVDPLGNIILSYKPDADPNKVFKDLERLLKISQIG